MKLFRAAATACALAATGLVLAALPATSALASTGTTVGQTGPPSTIVAFGDGLAEGLELVQTGGAAMPTGGFVTSFQTQAGSCIIAGGDGFPGGYSTSGDTYDFQVLRPLPNDQYQVLGDTGNITDPCDGALHTYTLSTPISVQAGDELGVYVPVGWQGALNESGGNVTAAVMPEPSAGDTVTIPNFKPLINAGLDESATLESTSEVAAATLVGDTGSVPPGTALPDKATAIQAEVQSGATSTACAGITDFLGLVQAQTGKKLTPAKAAQLTTDAGNLSAALSC